MRNFIRLGALAVISAVGISCTDTTSDEGKKDLNENIAFTLEVVEGSVESDQAKVKVEHNGERDDTWFGFATTESDINKAVFAKIEELLEEKGRITGLQKSTSKTVTARDLEPETDYTYIVIGMTEDGTYYGIPASVEFTTTRDVTDLEECNDWVMAYQRGEKDGEVIEYFTIQCETGNCFYFTTVNKLLLEAYEMTLEDYISYYVLESEIPQLQQMGYEMTELLVDQSYTLSGNRMESGDYYAIAIGFTKDGTATGYYSAHEFQIFEQTATEEYQKWLGTWTLTDANNQTFDITVHHYDNNFLYAITGWECGTGLRFDFSTAFEDVLAFAASYNDGKLGFEETFVTYLASSESAESYDLYFGLWGRGSLTYNGKTYEDSYIGFEGLTMAQATTEDGQNGTLEGITITETDFEINYQKMGFAGLPLVENLNISIWNEPMVFPITMTKKAEAATQQSVSAPAVMIKKSPKAEAAGKIRMFPYTNTEVVKRTSF